ncbi:hybrid sensor histidine kinase/response regulator [Schauerella aestuarii]|uniref:hybrid sensor histidine kinase/response regulator n=1 Tax=Schauerella aestuarii TaxID=2511204 RepID=UPI00136B2D9B|nr:PAS domain-containing sensor histidine kinase [Achromobacter aestuarii]MYZ45606.1 PAS domain-containing sensor histidine kinase [Achromobacter aestuarii]
MTHRSAAEGHRVIVAAPYGNDAASIISLLNQHQYDALACPTMDDVAAALDDHAGVVLITEEAIRSVGLDTLRDRLSEQPAWSDIPFIVLTARRTGVERARENVLARLLPFIGNAVVVERPLSLASLLSALTSAMRSRQKQFDMRDRLLELEAGRIALAASEAELRRISDALPVLIAFVGLDLRYRFANRAYEHWVKMDPADIVGKHIRDLVGEEGFALRLPTIQRALDGHDVRLELSWPHFDGRRRDADMRLLPRRDASGVVDGFHIFVQDITAQKETEERLEAHVAQRTAALTDEMSRREGVEEALRQSQKMEAVGQLTGGIAHDFNNMLTGITGSLELVKRRMAAGRTDGLDRFMDAALSSAQRAAGLTARLLAFSRRQSLDAKPLDVNVLVQSLEELLYRSISESIVLHVEGAPDLPHAIADANQLENAIINLVVNARDAMPDGGTLTVETKLVEVDAHTAEKQPDVTAGHYVVVAVSDTGVGMTPDILAKIFDPFFTTKPIGQGTGLGLSMVYGFARQSGGQVRVHSVPGTGTTVSIYLPCASQQQSRAPVAAAALAALPPQGKGEHVLIVEDDAAVRLLMREGLEELSYSVLEAEESNAAIRVLASNRPLAMMISDVGLPGMNGRQLAEIARQHRPDLPVLFVTGYAENAAIRAGFLGTNMSMITKPFSLDGLAVKVREMLNE